MQGNAAPGTEAFLTDTRTFVERCRLLKLDDIFFLATPPDLLQIAHLVEALSELPVTVHIIPTGVDKLWSSARIVSFGEALSIQVLRPPLSVFDLAVKRGIDICIAGLSLFACWPFLFMLSVAINFESRGPAIFRQRRHGYNNEVIPILKFRTMTVIEDAETAATFAQARANDPRINWSGAHSETDKHGRAPQLFNVLKGEMSIVGPRPHPIALNAK